MSGLAVIADDLTGACDVGSSFATAGVRARVVCTHDDASPAGEGLVVRNTQSRGVAPAEAAARVRDVVARSNADLLLKKIDTALRGHLGAELDAALDALGARAAIVVAAIPAAGRATRGGAQWFDGRLLATTEFAADPEGPGVESSIPAVIARESGSASAIVGLGQVRGVRLEAVLRERLAHGARHIVVDAESDADVLAAARAALALPRPLCIAGSIAIASALLDAGVIASPDGNRARPLALDRIEGPALVVCGSLHSNARAQVDALVRNAGARELRPTDLDAAPAPALAAEASRSLAAGRHVVVAAPRATGTPTEAALRATEAWLADVTAAVVRTRPPRTLALIGGESSYAIVRAIGATHLDVLARFRPLVVVSRIVTGVAAGVTLVTKGGSGGDATVLVDLLHAPLAAVAAAGR